MKSGKSSTLPIPDNPPPTNDNTITTFENLESQIGSDSTQQSSPGLKRRRPVPEVPKIAIVGKHNEPKLLDGDKEYDEFSLPLLLRPNVLSTFLTANTVESVAQLLQGQQIDLFSISLCSDEDLQAINVPLGPRKKISQALERRKHILLNPGPLSDSAV
ncbi:Usher syndrome type-1G protein-like [Oopsacas minuta]|uniref:Usher syndrome type-1G protein-like n=1 Tax=Oopsacas minuta TaxID=111878 RepID=A0AAV7KB65_9METZ|nr:Usher syndrome type-1G protein-like [Oopsacas minuta]